jgi:uncharacterized membrane protein
MAKTIIYIGAGIGGIVGAYAPVALFHVSEFGGVSLVAGFIGGAVGIWLGYKLSQWVEE